MGKSISVYLRENLFKLLATYLLAFSAACFLDKDLIPVEKLSSVGRNLNDVYYVLGITGFIGFVILISRTWLRARIQKSINSTRSRAGFFLFYHYLVFFALFFAVLFYLRSCKELTFFLTSSCLFFALILLIKHLLPKRKEEDVTRDSYFSDEAIRGDGEDTLGRVPFVNRLADEIRSLPFTDSFVFGLTGSVGDGKTSVINLLRQQFDGTNTHILIEYQPWSFADEKSMLIGFYDELEKAINKTMIVPGLRRALNRYAKVLDPEFSPPGIKFRLNFEESISDLKDRIEQYIIRANRKLLIVVDDIDRLEVDEILAVLKLVRLNARFRNTIFLLSFDRDIVERKLCKTSNARLYLEKFIQKETKLPVPEPARLDKFLDHHLDLLLEELAATPEEKKEFEKKFSNLYRHGVRRVFRNLRAMKLYLNNLRASLPPVRTEVNLFDFSALEILKIFFPAIYEDVWKNPQCYIEFNWLSPRSFEALYRLPSVTDNERNDGAIRQHIESILPSEPERETILNILQMIFPAHITRVFSRYSERAHESPENNLQNRRVRTEEFFDTYFLLNLGIDDIALSEINARLREWNTDKDGQLQRISRYLSKLTKTQQLIRFFEKLIWFKQEIPRPVVIPLIRAIYQDLGSFSKEMGGFEFGYRSEVDKARALLYHLVNSEAPNTQISSLVEEIALTTRYLPLAVSFASYCAPEPSVNGSRLHEYVDARDLERKIRCRFRQYFKDQRHHIFEEYSNLEEWRSIVLFWVNPNGGNTENFNDFNTYLINQLKTHPEDIAKILLHIIQYSQPDARQVYDIEGIRDVVNLFDSQNYFPPEHKEFVKEFYSRFPPKSPNQHDRTEGG